MINSFDILHNLMGFEILMGIIHCKIRFVNLAMQIVILATKSSKINLCMIMFSHDSTNKNNVQYLIILNKL